jgi:superfamily II DNA or RNA helicase
MVEPYGRSLIIVPGKDLVGQTWKDYVNIGLDTGRYFGDHKEPSNQHTIATWQSLTALDKNKPEVLEEILRDVVSVIIDEAHTVNGKELKDFLTGAVAHVPLRWGLTGTVPKEDFAFVSLLSAIGPNVGGVRAKELQDKNILSNCHIHVHQLVDNVTYATWDAERDYLSSDATRLTYLAKHCADIAKSGNTFVLVNSVKMGKALAADLGVPFIYGVTKTKNRSDEYDAINNGNDHLVIATFGVAAVGINVPRIFNLVLIEAGKSFKRVVQSAGRGLRTAADKDFVDIYDICSTTKFSKRHLTKRKEHYRDAEYPFTVTKIDYR